MRAEELCIIAAIVILTLVSLISFAKAQSLKKMESSKAAPAKGTGAPAGTGAAAPRGGPAAGGSGVPEKKKTVPAGTAARYKTTMERSIRTHQVRKEARSTDLQLLFQDNGRSVFWSCGNCGLENPRGESSCPLCGELRA